MRATKRTRSFCSVFPFPWTSALLLLLCLALLQGCAAGEKSLAGVEDLALALSRCLPPPPTGWLAEPVEIDTRITDLGAEKIDAARDYTEIEGKAEVEIDIRTSAWCCWLVTFSGDLEKLTIKDRTAGLDPKKNKAVLYVTLTHNVVVIFKADNMPNAVEAVKYFASKTDFDCLKKTLKKHKKST